MQTNPPLWITESDWISLASSQLTKYFSVKLALNKTLERYPGYFNKIGYSLMPKLLTFMDGVDNFFCLNPLNIVSVSPPPPQKRDT